MILPLRLKALSRLLDGFLVLPAVLCLSGCFSIQGRQPQPAAGLQPAAAKALANQKKQQLKQKTSPLQLPDTLGGAVTSERWVIYKEKEEEVFEGNVRYDNGTYSFRADYALSQRKKNLFTAKGNVFARYNNPEGGWYELYADKAVYNYQSGRGQAEASAPNRVKLVYQTAEGDLITAFAQKAEFNTKEKTYLLRDKVVIIYQNKEKETITLKAQQIHADQQKNYALLQGDCQAENANYSLKAQNIEYNGAQGYSYAYGGRPLLQGKTQDGTFAIIADKVTAENATRKFTLSGRVEGWTISKEINASRANESFDGSF